MCSTYQTYGSECLIEERNHVRYARLGDIYDCPIKIQIPLLRITCNILNQFNACYRISLNNDNKNQISQNN